MALLLSKAKHYSAEVKKRAVPIVQEARQDALTLGVAVESIAPKMIGYAGATLHEWVARLAEWHDGDRMRAHRGTGT
jgi:transposase